MTTGTKLLQSRTLYRPRKSTLFVVLENLFSAPTEFCIFHGRGPARARLSGVRVIAKLVLPPFFSVAKIDAVLGHQRLAGTRRAVARARFVCSRHESVWSFNTWCPKEVM
jgi:hypothetical protein